MLLALRSLFELLVAEDGGPYGRGLYDQIALYNRLPTPGTYVSGNYDVGLYDFGVDYYALVGRAVAQMVVPKQLAIFVSPDQTNMRA